MNITITGNLGSGKSSVCKELEKSGFAVISAGDIFREIAAEKGMTVIELNEAAKKDRSIDDMLDRRSTELGKKLDHTVFDSRLAWHFVESSFKVFLLVDTQEAARRVFDGAGRSAEAYQSLEEARAGLEERAGLEQERFQKLYGIDYYDAGNYDLVIESTYASPEQIAQEIQRNFLLYQEKPFSTKVELNLKCLYPSRRYADGQKNDQTENLKNQIEEQKKEDQTLCAEGSFCIIEKNGYHYLGKDHHRALNAIKAGRVFADIREMRMDEEAGRRVETLSESDRERFEQAAAFRYLVHPARMLEKSGYMIDFTKVFHNRKRQINVSGGRKMKKWTRARFQPNLPLYGDQARVTASTSHLELARRAAREGIVLLKNEKKILPVKKGTRLALFGKGVFDYVKGGGGSGDVTVSHVCNLYDGLTQREDPADIFEPLVQFYKENVKKQYQKGAAPGMTVEPEIPSELLAQAKEEADLAVIVISRFSGEGWDRKSVPYEGAVPSEIHQAELSRRVFENGDYYLTNAEQAMIEAVCADFTDVVVVLNVGGMVDTSWFAHNDNISAAMLAWQGGMEGGLAAADLLLGMESPSGKLPDTFATSLDGYPSTADFHESPDYVEYTEDIYVGYRYFETMKHEESRVNYPFGFGLSYTDFQIDVLWAGEKDGTICVIVQVQNTGEVAGKEVVQLYYGAPQGVLGKPARELAAYQKTDVLKPGEKQVLTLTFAVASMASYDDTGKVAKSAYVLEEGMYCFYVGNSVRDAEMIDYVYELDENQIVQQLTQMAAPSQLTRRMLSDGSFEELAKTTPHDFMENGLGWSSEETEGVVPMVRRRERYVIMSAQDDRKIMLDDVAEGKSDLNAFLAQLSDRDLAELLGGQPNTGVANTFGFGNLPEYGVPNVMTADGPAGLRIAPECGVCTTAWPCATMLASTWNPKLVREVGQAAAEEVKENNIAVWLAPAMNIHRSPLCGRNFEYYSEDPYLTGTIAAAMVEGIQSQNIAATVKHFACNNKETNRKNSDSRVSERALREIYLKGFEICVKNAQPWVLMSAYNLVNGHRASESKELLDGILRGEWGYQGVVVSDWWTKGEHYKEIKAGNDIKMGTGYPERALLALEKGLITREELAACARRVLELILKLD